MEIYSFKNLNRILFLFAAISISYYCAVTICNNMAFRNLLKAAYNFSDEFYKKFNSKFNGNFDVLYYTNGIIFIEIFYCLLLLLVFYIGIIKKKFQIKNISSLNLATCLIFSIAIIAQERFKYISFTYIALILFLGVCFFSIKGMCNLFILFTIFDIIVLCILNFIPIKENGSRGIDLEVLGDEYKTLLEKERIKVYLVDGKEINIYTKNNFCEKNIYITDEFLNHEISYPVIYHELGHIKFNHNINFIILETFLFKIIPLLIYILLYKIINRFEVEDEKKKYYYASYLLCFVYFLYPILNGIMNFYSCLHEYEADKFAYEAIGDRFIESFVYYFDNQKMILAGSTYLISIIYDKRHPTIASRLYNLYKIYSLKNN